MWFVANEIFTIVVSELEKQLGDILARGITKKALVKVASNENVATEMDMIKAMDIHIKPTLTTFMTPDKANVIIRHIKVKLRGRQSNAG